MRRLVVLLLAASASAPALAQHSGHPAPPAPQPDPHAGHGQPPAEPARAEPAPTEPVPAEPAPAEPAPAEDPHAGHAPPPPPSGEDPHAGHAAPAEDPHAGHAVPAQADAPPVGPPPPEAFSGPAHAADTVYGAGPMARAREALRATHGDMRAWRLGIDQLEVRLRDGGDGFAWTDAHFWYGGDLDRLWIESEGEGAFGEGVESGDVQALWSRAIDPWFDLQAGLRLNFGRGPERPHLVLGVQGLAPYWFEIDAAAYLSSKGDLTGSVEAEYDQRITQRLILQPRLELGWALQDVPELGIGSGLSSAEAGLRLRYELVPEFAPYVGVLYERAIGDTARFARSAGDDVGGWSLVLGLKAWF